MLATDSFYKRLKNTSKKQKFNKNPVKKKMQKSSIFSLWPILLNGYNLDSLEKGCKLII